MHVQPQPLRSGNTQRGCFPSSATSACPLLSVSLKKTKERTPPPHPQASLHPLINYFQVIHESNTLIRPPTNWSQLLTFPRERQQHGLSCLRPPPPLTGVSGGGKLCPAVGDILIVRRRRRRAKMGGET